MDTSLFLAQIWGLFMLILSVVFLVRRESLHMLLQAMDDEGFILMTGFISLLVGLLTVLTHNVWAFDWRGLITLFGWIAILKGIARFAFPGLTPRVRDAFEYSGAMATILLLITFLIGLYLTYVGFTG